jgi:hypothetical protein
MVRVDPNQLKNPQQLNATVTGPDGANTLFVFDGQFQATVQSYNTPNVAVRETFSVLLGPQLTRRQFVQATGVASISQFQWSMFAPNPSPTPQWTIDSVDADWDDESGQVELRVEAWVMGGTNLSVSITMFAYHVTALAEIAA